MSIAEPTPAEATEPKPTPKPRSRPLGKRVMHVVRRGHLYLGLFLLPWAIMYGATGFLFNHPEAFADVPTTTFGRSELIGTPMENPPSAVDLAQQVVTVLRSRANPPVDYQLVQPEKAKYNRETAFVTVKADGREVSLTVDALGNGGMIRNRATPQAAPPTTSEKAPFAIGGGGRPGAGGFQGGKGGGPQGGTKGGGRPGAGGGERGGAGQRPSPTPEAPLIESPLHERVKAAVPVVLERTGVPSGEVTVTSVPDLIFNMSEGEKTWVVTYNAQAGTVAGKLADEIPPPEELSNRRFLTRLHLTHVYPNEKNVKWAWTLIVDVMAFVMVFWGISGVFMWWQIKATRLVGFVILVLSMAVAVYLGMGMHDVISAGGR